MNVNVDMCLIDNLLQVGDTHSGQVSALDGVGQGILDRGFQRRNDVALAIDVDDACAVYISRDNDHGTDAAVGLVVKLACIGRGIALDGHKIEFVIVRQCSCIVASLIDDGNLLCLVPLIVQVGHHNRDGSQGDHQKWKKQSHNNE